MWPYHPNLLARPVPRYTSFPTAAEFAPLPPEVQVAALEALTGTALHPASLYVHIPFCEKICWYCGCNTSATGRGDRLAGYLAALTREFQLVAGRIPAGTRFGQVAFGGGSPNALAPHAFVELVHMLTLAFGLIGTEWSIELDPRTLTPDWERVLAGVGIRRASLGVQTFSPRLQAAIGRVQPDELIARAVDMVRRAGVTSLNFDLMYGLPGQTLADLEQSLLRTCELGADRIALFGYAHVPHMIARQRKIAAADLPDQAARFAMASFGHDLLTFAGYVPVGFDHFARPSDPLAQAARAGQLHRNFQGFTDDPAQAVIGLGASAISCFPGVLVQNEKHTGHYRDLVGSSMLAGTRGVIRTPRDVLSGQVITGLLCHGRADLTPLGPDALPARFEQSIAPFIERGLARVDAGELTILRAGLPYARTIAALFDHHRPVGSSRFSSAI
jgi:oxygen-independent coproporphyrinogen-3 oxidase